MAKKRAKKYSDKKVLEIEQYAYLEIPDSEEQNTVSEEVVSDAAELEGSEKARSAIDSLILQDIAETAPVEEYVDYEQLSSELEESQQAESIENVDSKETNFTGPPADSIPRTSGPTSLPL